MRKLLATLAITTGLLAYFTVAADASTPGCTHGTFAGYCGTQADNEASPLVFDVKGQVAAYDQPVIGYPDSTLDPATDFVMLAYDGGVFKMFIYAPQGVISNLCVAEPFKYAPLVLRPCNGKQWQLFEASQIGATTEYTWTNKATDDIVSANGLRGQLTGVAAPVAPAVPSASESWSFTS